MWGGFLNIYFHVFKNMNSGRLNSPSLKKRFTPSGCEDIGIKKFEFVAKNYIFLWTIHLKSYLLNLRTCRRFSSKGSWTQLLRKTLVLPICHSVDAIPSARSINLNKFISCQIDILHNFNHKSTSLSFTLLVVNWKLGHTRLQKHTSNWVNLFS